jgi:hypothetical protein
MRPIGMAYHASAVQSTREIDQVGLGSEVRVDCRDVLGPIAVVGIATSCHSARIALANIQIRIHIPISARILDVCDNRRDPHLHVRN